MKINITFCLGTLALLITSLGTAFAAPPAQGRYFITPNPPEAPFPIICDGTNCNFDLPPNPFTDPFAGPWISADPEANAPMGVSVATAPDGCPLVQYWFRTNPQDPTQGTFTKFIKECNPETGEPEPEAPWISSGGGMWKLAPTLALTNTCTMN